MPVDDITAERIVAEANNAFGFNLKMAQELEGSLIKALGQIFFNSLSHLSFVICRHCLFPSCSLLPTPLIHWKATQWFFYYLVSSLI